MGREIRFIVEDYCDTRGRGLRISCWVTVWPLVGNGWVSQLIACLSLRRRG